MTWTNSHGLINDKYFVFQTNDLGYFFFISYNRFDEPFDEKDMKPHIRLTSKDRRNDPNWYGRKIEEYGKQGKVNLKSA